MEFHHDYASNEYKTRNILRLTERVQVIREYDSFPTRRSYQSLATLFDCSAKQIKNILLNRESVLKAYKESGNSSYEDSRDEAAKKRQGKIDFLGKVLYEYLQRVVYFNYSVDEEKVRKKALEIKECIAIENFQPNNGWFDHFKVAYGISACDMESLQNNIQVTEEKRAHLSAIDMIQHVSREEQMIRKTDINGMRRKRGRPSRFEKLQWQSEAEALEPKIVHERNDEDEDADDDDDDDYCTDEQDRNGSCGDYNLFERPFGFKKTLPQPRPTKTQKTSFQDRVLEGFNKPKPTFQMLNMQLQFKKTKPKPTTIEMHSQQPAQKRKREDSPIPDIETAEKAVKYVKALEEYAMLQDNYRAIGLLTQLEQIFQKKCKNET